MRGLCFCQFSEESFSILHGPSMRYSLDGILLSQAATPRQFSVHLGFTGVRVSRGEMEGKISCFTQRERERERERGRADVRPTHTETQKEGVRGRARAREQEASSLDQPRPLAPRPDNSLVRVSQGERSLLLPIQ